MPVSPFDYIQISVALTKFLKILFYCKIYIGTLRLQKLQTSCSNNPYQNKGAKEHQALRDVYNITEIDLTCYQGVVIQTYPRLALESVSAKKNQIVEVCFTVHVQNVLLLKLTNLQ